VLKEFSVTLLISFQLLKLLQVDQAEAATPLFHAASRNKLTLNEFEARWLLWEVFHGLRFRSVSLVDPSTNENTTPLLVCIDNFVATYRQVFGVRKV